VIKTQQQDNAALYLRLSRDDGGDAESNSIGNQRAILQRYVAEAGLHMIGEYVDDGISGTTFDRDGFKRMIADVEAGKIGTILCKDLSRLGRNNALVAYYTEIYFIENRVRFIALNDGIDTLKGDNEIMPFKSVINEYYARDISKKIRSALRAQAHSGHFIGGPPPYGYMKDPADHHHLLPDPNTAPVVQRIFNMAAAGRTAYQIMHTLSKEKVLIPRAYTAQRTGKYQDTFNHNFPTDWCKLSVQNILRNRAYLGCVVSQKQTVKSFKQKKLVNRPEDEWIIVPGMHEPLVDEATFEKVQRLMSVKHPANVTDFDNIFRGLLRCADCGVHLAYQNIQGRHTDGSFCCNHYRQKRHCTAHYIRYSQLYEIVLRKVRDVAEAAQAHQADLEQLAKAIYGDHQAMSTQKEQRELERTQRRVKELDGIVKKLLEQNAAGAISDARFAALTADYDREQQTLQVVADALSDKIRQQKDGLADAKKFLQLVSQYLHIESLTGLILNELIDRIVVYDGVGRGNARTQRVDIHWRFVGLLPDIL
jgi:DNA invertase Pin-like site-specific DNA recombinase